MIGRRSTLIFGTQLISRFFGFIFIIILANFWGEYAVTTMGVIGFAMSFLAVFSLIGNLGFDSAHVKRVSEGKNLGTCIGTYISIKVILVSIMVIIILSSIFIWKNILNQNFTDATTESVTFVFILFYVFELLSRIPSYTFTATREIAKRQIVLITQNVTKIPFMILVVLAGANIAAGNKIPPVFEWPSFLLPFRNFLADHAIGSISTAYVLGVFLSLIVGLYLLRKYPIKKPTKEMINSYTYFAFPAMLLSVITIISTNIDKIMIGYFWTSMEVGYYFTVQQILEAVTIISVAVGTVLFPTLSNFHSANNHSKIKQITHQAERYVSMVIMPVGIVIIVLVEHFIRIILNEAFLPASSVLVILTFYALLGGLTMPYNSLIRGVNRPGITAKIGFVMCSTNIILNLLFIPKNGLLSFAGINGPTGAAIATTISCLIGFIAARIASKKLTNIKIFQKHTPKHIIAGVVMGITLYYTSNLVEIFRFYHLILFSLFGLSIYLSLLYIFKEFNKKDFLFFIDLLHPKKMFNYVSSELKNNKHK